jgi:hypothetical protein
LGRVGRLEDLFVFVDDVRGHVAEAHLGGPSVSEPATFRFFIVDLGGVMGGPTTVRVRKTDQQ